MRSTSARTISNSLRSDRKCGALRSLAVGRLLRNALSEWTWLMVIDGDGKGSALRAF
jgi:hypothetical protein